MASVASYVYTHLGVKALENWTNLTREMKSLKERLKKSEGDEVDKVLQEIHAVGIQISSILEEARVPPDLLS